MKKVAIIGTVGVPSRYGGFETLAHRLVQQLNKEFILSVYNSKTYYNKGERPSHWNGAKIHYLPFNANGVQSVIYDIISMLHAVLYADILLIFGVSGGLFIPIIRLFTSKKIIVNIDGCEWKRSKWNKFAKAFLKLSERVAVKYSHLDITDNSELKKYTADSYRTLSIQVEYGADHAVKKDIEAELKDKYPFLSGPYAFKVARIEPENNIHIILESFSELPNKNLVIIGNWDASRYGKNLKQIYSSTANIYLIDPIYDQNILDQFRSNCYVYIHGHSVGGTNPSLIEAMHLGLPIMALDVNFNRATTNNLAYFFRSKSELKILLNNTSYINLSKCGTQLREHAITRYSWKRICGMYTDLINSFDYNYKKKNVRSSLLKIDQKILNSLEIGHLKNTLLFFE